MYDRALYGDWEGKPNSIGEDVEHYVKSKAKPLQPYASWKSQSQQSAAQERTYENYCGKLGNSLKITRQITDIQRYKMVKRLQSDS